MSPIRKRIESEVDQAPDVPPNGQDNKPIELDESFLWFTFSPRDTKKKTLL